MGYVHQTHEPIFDQTRTLTSPAIASRHENRFRRIVDWCFILNRSQQMIRDSLFIVPNNTRRRKMRKASKTEVGGVTACCISLTSIYGEIPRYSRVHDRDMVPERDVVGDIRKWAGLLQLVCGWLHAARMLTKETLRLRD